MNVPDLRRQAKRRVTRLSPEKLRVADDFLAYLEERESNAATEELLNIPGFMDALKRADEQIARGETHAWRDIRRDV